MNAAVPDRAFSDTFVPNEALFLFKEPAHIYGFYQWWGREQTTPFTATRIEPPRITNTFLPFVATTTPEPGVVLEGCLYPKNNQQKTARILPHLDRFLFLLLFLTFLLLIP